MLVLSALVLAASAFAQEIHVLSPVQNQTVVLGQPLVITISQTFQGPGIPFEDVAVAIGVEHCGATPCSLDENDQVLGQIISRDLFNPTLDVSKPLDPPIQNITVVPTGEAGFATLHAVAFVLIGTGPAAQFVQQDVDIFLTSA